MLSEHDLLVHHGNTKRREFNTKKRQVHERKVESNSFEIVDRNGNETILTKIRS